MDEKSFDETMKGIYDKLTDEQKEKAKACKDMDEFMEHAGEWGIELPDEMVDAVAGGTKRKPIRREEEESGSFVRLPM